MTSDNGTSLGTIKYYPYGECRNSQPEIENFPTDRLFTGQRYDDTGLYYYGARYYDPIIGRFISPDATIPDGGNPQSYNRYSYCINNPMKYIDPNGLDYIIVGGAGTKWSDTWWTDLLKGIGWKAEGGERVLFIPNEKGGVFEIGDQEAALKDALENGSYKDIKLIGHSEGACAIAKVLDQVAEDNYLAGTDVKNQLRGAVLMETITGFADFAVLNWDDAALVDLPRRLFRSGVFMSFADISSYGSWIHNVEREGWENYRHEVKTDGEYIWGKHSAITTDQETYNIIQDTFRTNRHYDPYMGYLGYQ